MGDRNLTDADATAIATAIVEATRSGAGCDGCPFEEDHREWVETGEKYIPTKSLPALGKFSVMIDNMEKEIGMWVLRTVVFIGGGAGLIFVLVKLKVVKFGP